MQNLQAAGHIVGEELEAKPRLNSAGTTLPLSGSRQRHPALLQARQALGSVVAAGRASSGTVAGLCE